MPNQDQDQKQEDYPELEGLTLTYFNQDDLDAPPITFQAKVVGCNRAIGLTLVDATNPEVFVICLDRKRFAENQHLDNYEHLFDHCVAGIRAGYLDTSDSVVYPEIEGKDVPLSCVPTAEHCPFGR